MKKILLTFSIVALLAAGCNSSQQASTGTNNNETASSKVLQVVAAENFWGSLVSQIGGSHVQVLSIVSDPNADPHEYESNASDARAVADADYVIENGAGYDSWMDKLLSASNSQNQKVLNVASSAWKKRRRQSAYVVRPQLCKYRYCPNGAGSYFS